MRGLLVAFLMSLPLTSFADETVEAEEAPTQVSAAQLVREHVREHMDLHTRGLRYRFTIPSKRRGMPPLKFEVEGPVHRGEPGLRITFRF